MSKTELFLKHKVTRRWQQVVEDRPRVLAFSPYLTDSAVVRALGVLGQRCELYTDMTPDNFIASASSLTCVRRLLDCGVRVFHLTGVHAKIVLVPGVAVTVGSQNFTAGGSRNLEATVVTDDPRIVRQAETEATEWIERGKPRLVTREWLDDLDRTVGRMRREYHGWKRKVKGEADSFWERQDRREAEERERQRQAEVEARRLAELQRQADEAAAHRERAHPPSRSPRLREAREVVWGAVTNASGWSLRTTGDRTYTAWQIDGRPEYLAKSWWYPCYVRDTRRWGWVRVFPTCISFADFPSVSVPGVVVDGVTFRAITAEAVRSETPMNANIRITAATAGGVGTLYGWYTPPDIIIDTVVAHQEGQRPAFDRLADAIRADACGARSALLNALTSRRSYGWLGNNRRITGLLDQKREYFTRLARLSGSGDKNLVLLFARA